MNLQQLISRMGAFCLWVAGNGKLFGVAALCALLVMVTAGVALSALDGIALSQGLKEVAMNREQPETLKDVSAGVSRMLHPKKLIEIIDRMDADIDENMERNDRDDSHENEVDGPQDRLAVDGVLSEAREGAAPDAEEAFVFQMTDDDKEQVNVTIGQEAFEEDFNEDLSEIEEGSGEARPDPFAPLVFSGEGGIQIVGPENEVEKDPLEDIQFNGVIGDVEGKGEDAVAIIRVNSTGGADVLVMRAGGEFDLNGVAVELKKVESGRILVKTPEEERYIELTTFIDNVATTSADETENEGSLDDEDFEDVEEFE